MEGNTNKISGTHWKEYKDIDKRIMAKFKEQKKVKGTGEKIQSSAFTLCF